MRAVQITRFGGPEVLEIVDVHRTGAGARLRSACNSLPPAGPPGASPMPSLAALSLTWMRAVQITRFGGPEVLEIVDFPEPMPGPGQQLYDVSTAGLNFADTHHRLSVN